MDGETQLRALELKEHTIGIQGNTLPEKDHKELLRAREIEKSGSIFAEERLDPILEAAYQRAIARGDSISNNNYADTEDTEGVPRKDLRSTTGYTGVKRKPPTKTRRVDSNYPSSQKPYPDSSTNEPSTGQHGDQATSDILSLAEEGAMVADEMISDDNNAYITSKKLLPLRNKKNQTLIIGATCFFKQKTAYEILA